MKAKDHSKLIIEAYNYYVNTNNSERLTNQVSKTLTDIAFHDLKQLREQRKISNDNSLLELIKELRTKYISVVNHVNPKTKPNLLEVADFDSAFEELYPNLGTWYKQNITLLK